MAQISGHLSVAELEERYRAARDATEARHLQAIWLLAQGRTTLEVADVLAFTPRWVGRNWLRATTRTALALWATSGGATGAPRAC